MQFLLAHVHSMTNNRCSNSDARDRIITIMKLKQRVIAICAVTSLFLLYMHCLTTFAVKRQSAIGEKFADCQLDAAPALGTWFNYSKHPHSPTFPTHQLSRTVVQQLTRYGKCIMYI